MNMNQMILDAYRHRNKNGLNVIKESLTEDLQTLDTFFDEYLDLFSDRMSATEDTKDPVWRAYKDKLNEQKIAKQNLKLAEYYLGMI